MTNERAVYDLYARLGKNSDDNDLPYQLVAQWLSTARANVIIDRLIRNGNEISPSMTIKKECASISTHQECNGCPTKYVELPVQVLDLPNDIGVYDVRRSGGLPIDRFGSFSNYTILQGSPQYIPKHGYYRDGNKIMLIGNYPETQKITITYVPYDIVELDRKDRFPVDTTIVATVMDIATKIGAQQLGIPIDINNDGKDQTQT